MTLTSTCAIYGVLNAHASISDADTPAESPPVGPDLRTPQGEAVLPPYRWTVQVFADMFGTTPRALRFYESKGLLAPARESAGRVYGAAEFLRMERIARAKRLGFTLDDIREVFEVIDGEVTDRGELQRRRGNFQRVLGGLDRRRADLDSVADDMRALVGQIDAHLASIPSGQPSADTTVFQFAKAYEDRLQRSLQH